MPTIFYSPHNGAPYLVPDGMENDYLRNGYRTDPPENPPQPLTPDQPTTMADIERSMAVRPTQEYHSPGVQIEKLNYSTSPATHIEASVDVNAANIKTLSESLALSTSIARKLIAGRPYRNIEDVIEKNPGYDWATLKDRVTFGETVAEGQ